MAGKTQLHEVLGDREPQFVTPRGADRLTPVAIALALGAMMGWSWPWLPVWWLIGGAAACALLVLLLRARLTKPAGIALLLLGATLFGMAWPIVRHYTVATDDLARLAEAQPALVRLRGVVTSSPQLRQTAGGSMAPFNYQPPRYVFEVDAKALVDRAGTAHAESSRVWVTAPIDMPKLKPGDIVELAGSMRAPGGPDNPGQFDFWRFARAHNQSAMLSVGDSRLMTIMMSHPTSTLWITRMRDALRERATAWLQADMPESFHDGASHHRAVLQAILIGERAPELHEVGAAMQRTGIAHLMAISGLHLGILVGLVLFVLGAGREPRRWHGAAAIVLVLVYLMLVEVRVPVLRAGVMLSAASLGIVLGRRVAIGGLVSLSMIFMVLIAPAEVTNAGFQLSFGVLYAILFLAPPLRERWFGRADMLAASTRSMLLEWLKSGISVAVVAWMVASPVVLFHFGIVSPLGVPLSLVGVPLAGVVLALGYLKMVLSALLPSAGLVVGAALAWLTEFLIWLVLRIDEIPGASMALPMPGVVWTVLAVGWMVAIVLAREKRTMRALWVSGAVLALWLCWPMLPIHAQKPLRVDMLAVGDGSCYVIRSAGETMVFDAGTMGDPGSGARIMVPALRHLGVRRVDTLFVSHANLDHFSAMIEIVDAFGADQLLVTPQFAAEAESAGEPEHALFEAMRDRNVAVRHVSAGETQTFGEATFTWLHPRADSNYERINDTAMVVRMHAAGRTMLLTGDIQQQAIDDIFATIDAEQLRADVLELPHHGGFSDEAVAFVKAAQPVAILQSTGWNRLRRDRWADVLTELGVQRFVTARDGACWVAIERDGSIIGGRFHDETYAEGIVISPAR